MNAKGLLKKLSFILVFVIALVSYGCAKTETDDIFRFEITEAEMEVGEKINIGVIAGNVSEKAEVRYYAEILKTISKAQTTQNDFANTYDPNIEVVFNDLETLVKFKWFTQFAKDEISAACKANKLTGSKVNNILEFLQELIEFNVKAIKDDKYDDAKECFAQFIHRLINANNASATAGIEKYNDYTVDYSKNAEKLAAFVELYKQNAEVEDKEQLSLQTFADSVVAAFNAVEFESREEWVKTNSYVSVKGAKEDANGVYQTVNKEIDITAKKEGRVRFNAEVVGKEEYSDMIYITIVSVKVASVNIKTDGLTKDKNGNYQLPYGSSGQFEIEVLPNDAVYSVNWLSSDTSIVNIVSNGKYKAVASGNDNDASVVITAVVTTKDGNVIEAKLNLVMVKPAA